MDVTLATICGFRMELYETFNFIVIQLHFNKTGWNLMVRVMVFNAIFNYISVKFVEETGVPGENHRPAAIHWQTLSHNVASSTPCLGGIQAYDVSSDKNW